MVHIHVENIKFVATFATPKDILSFLMYIIDVVS